MRMTHLVGITGGLLLGASAIAPAQDQVVIVGRPRELTTAGLAARVDSVLDGQTLKKGDVYKLLGDLITDYFDSTTTNVNSNDLYCIVHLARWNSKPAAARRTGQPEGDHNEPGSGSIGDGRWYVFRGGSKKNLKEGLPEQRVLGRQKVHLLYIALNLPADAAKLIRYRTEVTRKTPANVQNLRDAIAFALNPEAPALLTDSSKATPINNWIGGGELAVSVIPSDMKVRAQIADNQLGAFQDASTETFDNEGLYSWDVSFALPLSKISQLEYSVQDGQVSASEVERDKLFFLLNWFPIKADIKKGFVVPPHFVGGVSIASNPLDRWMVGIATGLGPAQVFLGSAFTRVSEPSTLEEGDAVTDAQLQSDLKRKYEPSFVVGLNLSTRATISAVKGDANKKKGP